MELLELLEARYSVRSFSDRKVEKEKISKILLAARSAPTAHNNQPERILSVESREGLEKWAACTPCHFHEQLVLIVCCDRAAAWKRSFDGQDSVFTDGAIVTSHMMLEAWEQGIGSTWVMNFDPAALRREFGIPDGLVPVSVLAMGYPSEDAKPGPRHTERKDLKETVFYEHF